MKLTWHPCVHDGLKAFNTQSTTGAVITIMQQREAGNRWTLYIDLVYFAETTYLDRAKRLGQFIIDGLAAEKRCSAPPDKRINDTINIMVGNTHERRFRPTR